MSNEIQARIVSCPRCKGDSLYSSSNPYRPFCSARCKNLDFGAWAAESYRVETAPSLDESLDAQEPDPAAGSTPRH